MLYREFSTDEVADAIEQLAQDCADDDEWCEGVTMGQRVSEKVNDWCCYPLDAIMLCAYYDPFDAVRGYESYEDTPIAQFENDVYRRAVEIRGHDDE